MTFTIPQFILGVIATLVVEVLFIIIYAINSNSKNKN